MNWRRLGAGSIGIGLLGLVLGLFLIFILKAEGYNNTIYMAGPAILFYGGGAALVLGMVFFVIDELLHFAEPQPSSKKIPEEDLTPEQRLKKRQLEIEERKQQREDLELLSSVMFGSNNDDSSSGSSFSLTDSMKQLKHKYSGEYLKSPKCPHCQSQGAYQIGDEQVFQCDNCGELFETRSKTRRDINLNIEDR